MDTTQGSPRVKWYHLSLYYLGAYIYTWLLYGKLPGWYYYSYRELGWLYYGFCLTETSLLYTFYTFPFGQGSFKSTLGVSFIPLCSFI